MRWAVSVLAAVLMASPAYGQADSVAETVEWDVHRAGDTLVVPDGQTWFVIDRPEINRLRVRQRNDSIRQAALADAKDSLAAALDSMGSALAGCEERVAGLRTIVGAQDTALRYERDAREALQDAQPGFFEDLLGGGNGFVIGGAVGAVTTAVACGAGG